MPGFHAVWNRQWIINSPNVVLVRGKTRRACLLRSGGPQIGEVTCGGSPHLSCKRVQIKMRDYMHRRVTPPKRVTSPTREPHLPVNRSLRWPNLFIRALVTFLNRAFRLWFLASLIKTTATLWKSYLFSCRYKTVWDISLYTVLQ